MHQQLRHAARAALPFALILACGGAAAQDMSATVRPGDDFFDYVNGDWLAKTGIPADRSSWGTGAQLTEDTNQRIRQLIEALAEDAKTGGEARKVADAYSAFMDQKGIEAQGLTPLKPALDEIAAIKDRAALTRALGAGLRADVDPLNATNFYTENLFGIWIAQGLSDPQHYRPYLLQGGLGMPDRAYYIDDNAHMAELRGKYRTHIERMFRLAGLDDPAGRAARVFDLETQIAQVHATREESEDVQKGNNPWKLADFSVNAPGIDWPALFRAAGLGAQRDFIAWHPDAIKGEAALVTLAPLDAWKDWLAFHRINHYADVLPEAIAQEKFDFEGRTLSGTPEQQARWKRALAATDSELSDALGHLYVQRYFPAENKARIQAMVKNIAAAFDRRIDHLDWMAPATRAQARAKLKTLYVGIGYPDRWRSYEGLDISRSDAYGNAVRAEQFHYRQELAKLGRRVDRTEWCMAPQLVNAVNMPLQNALNFPAAILQPPYFDATASDAHNYGAIGSIIGHEISHSFDDQGAQFDAQGRLRDWWTSADGEHFRKAAGALAAQYSAYKPFPDLAINGQQTLSENLADLAGLNASFDAYRLSLAGKPADTAGQREFFIGYAQSWRNKLRDEALRRRVLTDGHSPARWRTYTVRNLDAWYAVFDVQPGQRLYLPPEQRVRVW